VVREQLARVSFPSDAIGVTKDIKGSIVMEPGNTIQAGRSKITVDLTTLKSDEDRRDRYIKANTLQTNRFPTAEFILREVRGLTSPLPHTGEAQFQALGDMTIHGVTKPLTWDVSASFAEKEITGRATTSFQFGDFGMTVPRVLVVLSVEDKIQLVINFRLSRTG
jgi:polyisoprenoid-binding protein YceI